MTPVRLRPLAEELPPRLLYTTAVINIMGVNANGIRTKRKRLMLHRLLRELRAGVAVITETHMRRRELGGLTFPDYYIGNEYCRPTPPGERIWGGGGSHTGKPRNSGRGHHRGKGSGANC